MLLLKQVWIGRKSKVGALNRKYYVPPMLFGHSTFELLTPQKTVDSLECNTSPSLTVMYTITRYVYGLVTETSRELAAIFTLAPSVTRTSDSIRTSHML